jgi:hypothetical protein
MTRPKGVGRPNYGSALAIRVMKIAYKINFAGAVSFVVSRKNEARAVRTDTYT